MDRLLRLRAMTLTQFCTLAAGAFLTLAHVAVADNGDWNVGTAGKIYTTNHTVGINTTTFGSSRLQVNGNMAIGYSANTSSPTNGLNVSGNLQIGGGAPSTYTSLWINRGPSNQDGVVTVVGAGPNTAGYEIYKYTAATGYQRKWYMFCSQNTNPTYWPEDDLVFASCTPAWAERVFFKPDGRVGIGTRFPQSKLAVNGTITAKEVNVTVSGWSDFVFDSSYALKPLNEVEKSIKLHKHLEGIPTAKEVAANGVSVGEMQAKLLQKTEELTLYLIALQKQNDATMALNRALGARVAELEKSRQ